MPMPALGLVPTAAPLLNPKSLKGIMITQRLNGRGMTVVNPSLHWIGRGDNVESHPGKAPAADVGL